LPAERTERFAEWMYHVGSIDSLELAELAPYRTMRFQEEHRRQRIFVAEGDKVVRRLLESELGVVSALLPKEWFETLEPLLRKRPEDIRVFLAEKKLLEHLSGFTMYQGVLAVGRMPAPIMLEQALGGGPRPRLWVAVDGLTSSENMGALVRNCAAFGAHALLVGETCSHPYLRRSVRSSMGTIFRLPIVETAVLTRALVELRSRGIRVVAAHPHANQRAITQAELAGDCCLVFGSEGTGLSAEVLAACDEAVAIPMPAAVDSLNVASAAAVFLYEATRRRKAVTSIA
jgi:tRNA G18 (ribose-2'-O)-methylase SpoU